MFGCSHRKAGQDESGNVLFLILIAVALFAALSYAVTSSTRSSGGDASGETNLISSAQIVQYPSAVSTAIVRMVIGGATIDEIRFNRPAEFEELDSEAIGVFHPNGGGATYITAPPDIMADGQPGEWVFNGEMEVTDIGLNGAGGNDIVAYLIGLKQSICRKINEEHGLGKVIPILDADRESQYTTRMYDDGVSDYELPATAVAAIEAAGSDAGFFDGKPYGCFQNAGGDGEYVYYHVVVER